MAKKKLIGRGSWDGKDRFKPTPSSLIERKITILGSGDMTDTEADRLINYLEDQLSMGLDAVGRGIVKKFGGGKLTFKVEE